VSLAVLEGVGLGFGGRTLFSDLNLRIGEEDRIGVVGRNGSGKSSLFKLVAGTAEPTGGVVRRSRGLRLGYLAQEIDVPGGASLIDTVLASVPGKSELESMLATVEDELAVATTEDEQMALAQKLADLHEDLGHFDSTYSRHEALAILAGLGFSDADMARDVAELSGGWRMRAVLAGLLFQKPDLLLLDEPTNHLDVPSVAWLGGFLARYRGAFMLVCHDRTFLNEQISRVVAFEAEGVRQYAGDYENYLVARREELSILERRAANVAREREQAERFIRRFRAQATKARAVQSRIKALDRMDEIDVPLSERSLSFRFPPCGRVGTDVMTLRDLGHSYGDLKVFDGVNLTVRRGERIAIVGANGNGKTTLLKIMAGALAPTSGEAAPGHNATVGYYAQHVTELLDTRSTVFDEVWRHSAVSDVSQVRTALGTMLFSGDDVDKLISVLSGGEKARVALARLLVNPGNVILMDEPTNHLDLESSEALASALTTFDGTLAFVSHNRSFAARLATRVWNVEDGRVEEFPGTFPEYIDHCRRVARGDQADAAAGGRDAKPSSAGAGSKSSASGSKPSASGSKASGSGSRSSTSGSKASASGSKAAAGRSKAAAKGARAAGGSKSAASALTGGSGAGEATAAAGREASSSASSGRERRKSNNAMRALERKVIDLEKRIASLEATQAERSAELSKPETYADQQRYNELLGCFQRDADKLEELMGRWEHAQAQLEEPAADR